MKKNHYPCVLTIAGSDSSGGAGIQADIKAISATGCYAASVITALTAQNTHGVQAIQNVDPHFVTQQIESVLSDLLIPAVKIGMLHNEEVITVVIAALIKFKPRYIVLDPVMIAKNGCELLPLSTLNLLKKNLFPLVTLITPNLFEAEKIVDKTISNADQQAAAAREIGSQFNINVLVKGGHLQGRQSSDVVYLREQQICHWLHAERIATPNTHGTGCSLSSAIASYLAQGYPLLQAIAAAKQYLTQALQHSRNFHIGQGCGPVQHFWNLGPV